MKQIKLTLKQIAKLKEISDYFLEAVTIIDDTTLKAKVSAKILSRVSCLADRLVIVKGKWNIGDVVVDEDGCVGIVGIRYADFDFCTIENDSAHPNPKRTDKKVMTSFAGIVKAAKGLL
jgi:hypothetical protein